MKPLLLIGLFLGLTIFTYGQTMEDKQSVIQMSIDLVDLQPYYRADKIKGRKPLVISDNGIVPANLKLTKFGEPVEFMTKEELFFNVKTEYLDFEKFEISPTQADVEFQYNVEGLTIRLTFEKSDDNWVIGTKKLIEE